MSIKLYDDAVVKKLQGWVKDESITITSPNETKRLFQYRADEGNDKPLQFPIIALSRQTNVPILNVNKKPLTFDGKTITYSTRNNIPQKGYILNAIPIQLTYQLDVYTRYFEEADEYARNFVFNLVNSPKVQVEIPYNNAQMMLSSTIKLLPSIDDNSDIPERLAPGEFSRITLQFTIDDAYLWDYRSKDNVYIDDIHIDIKQ